MAARLSSRGSLNLYSLRAMKPTTNVQHLQMLSFQVSRSLTGKIPADNLSLNDFMRPNSPPNSQTSSSPERAKNYIENVPYLQEKHIMGMGRKVYFETYGCQMNVNDTEIALSFLLEKGFIKTAELTKADVILLVTCSIRENAETKIWNRLKHLKHLRLKRKKTLPQLKIGVLGCMAERLKTKLLEHDQLVDIVCGPDSYRDLPRLLSTAHSGQPAVNVMLSLDETYADITPVRLKPTHPSGYVSIMRGCNNMCTYCIVPFTRGRERSRPIMSIVDEVKHLVDQGVKEVTLLGQNVNSYRDLSSAETESNHNDSITMSRGFKTIYKVKTTGETFSELLDQVSQVSDELRVRFTSPHPKDFPDKLLQLIQERPNICKHIHLPAQSGSTKVLESMRRGYTRETYLELVEHIRNTVPDVALSSDFIAGFCGETEDDHRQSLSLLEVIKFDMAYLFAYSMREKTRAYHRLQDDVPAIIKQKRLQELINLFYSLTQEKNKRHIGTRQLILIEGPSKKSKTHLVGRNDGNTKVIIPDIPCSETNASAVSLKPGDYVAVEILSSSALTLKASPLYRTSIKNFHRL